MRRKARLLAPFLFGLLAFTVFQIYKIEAMIPDTVYTVPDTSVKLPEIEKYPFLDLVETVSASQNGKRTIDCYFADRILVKQIEVKETERTYVEPGGEPVGVFMETNGVLVIDEQEVETLDGHRVYPAQHLLQAGDYIFELNGKRLETKAELLSFLKTYTGGDIQCKVQRGNETLCVTVHAVESAEGGYKLGLWVKDDSQGIGTLTFTTANGSFAALGHGISDTDTGSILDLRDGRLYTAQILGIEKGSAGKPGELSGVIYYDEGNELGVIEENDVCGVFGKWEKKETNGERQTDPMAIAFKQEIQEGPATVLCCVSNRVEEYDVRVEKIYWNAQNTNKCFVLRVTDPELLNKTGGIVQGMSGSPILQNGKLIGAVTHVFVQDATSGYGVFAETMLERISERTGMD